MAMAKYGDLIKKILIYSASPPYFLVHYISYIVFFLIFSFFPAYSDTFGHCHKFFIYLNIATAMFSVRPFH
jgi:hypothetical protein